jgi:hypothetical protein
MKTIRLLPFAVLLFACAPASAQAPVPADQLEAISKLDWLVGKWKGEGWIEFRPGERRNFAQTETVQKKAGGTVLTIEGHGTTQSAGTNMTVLDAFTVLSYNSGEKKYRWHSHTDKGHATDVEVKVGKRTFQWAVDAGNFGTMRYTMVLNEKGDWFEIGEMSQDGQAWRKFFEMSLQKAPS